MTITAETAVWVTPSGMGGTFTEDGPALPAAGVKADAVLHKIQLPGLISHLQHLRRHPYQGCLSGILSQNFPRGRRKLALFFTHVDLERRPSVLAFGGRGP